MKFLSRVLLILLACLFLLVSVSSGYQGSGAIWAQRVGDFVSRNFRGDSTGFGQARDYCLAAGGGVIQVGPGMENVTLTYPPDAGLLVVRSFITGWSVDPPAAEGTSGAGVIEAVRSGEVYKQPFAGTSAGLQAAVDYLTTGGTVLIYGGRYSLTSNINIAKSGITIIGFGDSTIVSVAEGDTAFTVANGVSDVSISRMTIEGWGKNAGVGVAVYSAANTYINDITFRDIGDVAIYSTAGSNHLDVTDCRFVRIGSAVTTSGTAIKLNGSEYVRINRCEIDSTRGFGIYLRDCLRPVITGNTLIQAAYPGNGTTFESYETAEGVAILVDTLSLAAQIRDNFVISSGYSGIDCLADSSVIQGNTVSGGTYGSHIHAAGTARNTRYDGNTYTDQSQIGVFVEAGGRWGEITGLAFTNNTFVNPGQDGINWEAFIYPTRDHVIAGNRFYSPGTTGMRLKCRTNGEYVNMTITGNEIYNTGTHGIWLDFTSGATANFDSLRIVNNRIINTGGDGVFAEAFPLTPLLYLSDNIYQGVTGAEENINAVWDVVGTAVTPSRKSFFVAEDSLRVNGVARFDTGINVTGNSWIAGTLTTNGSSLNGLVDVNDSLRVNRVANFDQSIQATGDSWIAGKFVVRDSTRTLRGIYSDSLRARKILVQDSIRINNGIDVSSGNIVVKNGNSYQLRDTGGTGRAFATSSGTDNLNLFPLSGSGRINLRNFANTLDAVSTNSTGDVFISSTAVVGDSLVVAGPAIHNGKSVAIDSLNLSGILRVGRKNGVPQSHSVGSGGTAAGDTVTIVLDGTSDNSGLATRGPKIIFNRNGATEATIASYAGGLELRTLATDRLAFGTLGTTATTSAIFGDGTSDFDGAMNVDALATIDSLSVPTGNIAAGQHITLASGKYIVGSGTAGIVLGNTGTFKMKTTGGADATVIGTAGGTDILRLSPLISGGSIDILNFAATNSNLTIQDAGPVVFRPFTQAALPTVVNGGAVYCSDCNKASTPCTGGGTGAMAFGINGQWDCGP